MNDLMSALAIFAKYTSDDHPTSCEHDVLCVIVDPAVVSAEDRALLDGRGFIAQPREGIFRSHRFGGA